MASETECLSVLTAARSSRILEDIWEEIDARLKVNAPLLYQYPAALMNS